MPWYGAGRGHTCRHSSSSEVRCNSGSWKGARPLERTRLYRWYATPGWHRPARPRRCLSLAAEIQVACTPPPARPHDVRAPASHSCASSLGCIIAEMTAFTNGIAVRVQVAQTAPVRHVLWLQWGFRTNSSGACRALLDAAHLFKCQQSAAAPFSVQPWRQCAPGG